MEGEGREGEKITVLREVWEQKEIMRISYYGSLQKSAKQPEKHASEVWVWK